MSQTPPPREPPTIDNPQPAAPVKRGPDSAPTASNQKADQPTLAPVGSLSEPGGLVGQVFGDFELTEEVGRGGMGVVYKAIQRSLGRPVALKLLLSEFASNPVMLSRFLAEARAAASLAHPNIINIYQISECPAGPYFVMEFIAGPSVEQLLSRTLPVAWVVSLITTVAEAIQHAHDRHIIHRDLKPGNILLHEQKRPVVTDFGIAKVIGSGSASLTRPGAVIGTPSYMPPEQAGDEPSKIGPHSDVYSLGAIAYTLLSGRVPFDEGTAMRTILRVISDKPPPPIRSLRPEVPAALEQIVMKCLQKQPSARYASAQALANDLKRFRAAAQKNPAPAPPPKSTAPASVRATLPALVLVGEGNKKVRLVNGSTVIGRAPECDLVVKASEVSKRHCRVVISRTGATVEDLGSVNGTFVNGRQLKPDEPVELEDGDRLDLAGHEFTVHLQAPSGG